MSVGTTPQTRYAMSGDVHVAYQVLGDGPVDLVCVPGWISNIELAWTAPVAGRLLPEPRRRSRA